MSFWSFYLKSVDMYRIILLIIFIAASVTLSGQKEDYIWIMGADKSFSIYNGYLFDFNNPPMEVQEHDNNIGLGQANTSICDKDGNLLMYMNGCAVMNRNFEMMENGDSLSYDIWWEVFNKDCDRGFNGLQDNIILQAPSNKDLYYILHKPKIYNGNGQRDSLPIWYSKVNISKNNGLGEVIEKNVILDNSTNFVSSYLTAIKHANGVDWWILQPVSDDSLFHIYSLTDEGVVLDTILNSEYYFANGMTSSSGTAKFSPDGTKYALYNDDSGILLYDFDRETGILSFNERIITYDTPGLGIFSSVEWSPNSRFIYTATSTKLHQVDLWEENIQEDGVRLIDTYNGTQDPFSTTFNFMAQAPDCKIYMCPTSGTNSYHVIHRPNELGTACYFVQNGLKLPHVSNFGGMPNFPRFRVDEEDKCDPMLTSVFGNAVYYRKDLNVYPSPSSGRYTVYIPDEFNKGTMTILNLDGHIIRQQEISFRTMSIEVDITSFPSGYYNVELHPDGNKKRVFWGVQVMKN
jgi:hypothetical protein